MNSTKEVDKTDFNALLFHSFIFIRQWEHEFGNELFNIWDSTKVIKVKAEDEEEKHNQTLTSDDIY